jgi:hypothetical protein
MMTAKYEEQLPDLVRRVEALNKVFWEILRIAIQEALGEPLVDCTRCGKPMLPRRTYAKLTEDQKKAIRGFILKGYTGVYCATCQGSVNQLSDAEVARLRGQVGA